ncbi:polysaccharide lyase 8 family protein [Paenibacillus sp. 1P07SE]|uniref:polysaccharide lyase 8 family protein n=1 Tax=Paenibacillus sp. 1P07SE TaxID=3132209 RepID=UPI0039A60884
MKRFTSKSTVILLIIAMLTFTTGLTETATVNAADEYDEMRTKWKLMITGGTSYNTSDPDIAPKIAAITSAAQASWTAMNASKYWNDLASSSDSSQIKDAFTRLYGMALAHSTYGSTLYGSTSLKNDIVTGLNWYYSNRYNEGATAYDNWADWELHSPRVILDTLALLYDEIPSATRTNLLAAVDHFVPVPTRSGSNRIVSAWIVMGSGVIGKSGSKITAGRNGLAPEFDYVTSSSGYYRDGSYIFHSRHPYNGGYGVTSIDEMSKALYLLSGTSYWSGLDPDYTNVFQWIYDAYEPLIFKGEMPDMVRGRNNTRPQTAYAHERGHAVMTAMIRLADLGTSESPRLRSLVKYLIQSDTVLSYYTSADINFVVKGKAIVADPGIVSRGHLSLTKVYANMARLTSMRPDYMFGVSASSSRVYNYQGFAENKKGWYTGDGMTYLYRTGENQYGDAFWATVDPYRLPGTTVDRFTRANSDGSDYLSSKNWVGGTAVHGKYAAFGMELDAWNSTLTAKKSWFTFDDEIVALGSGITNSDSRTIETTIENRKINTSGNNALKVNGSAKSTSLGWSETMTGVNWIHLAGTGGYYFPTAQTVKGLREARTGNFNAVNSTYGTSTNHTRNYMTLWFDHGINPTNNTYAYVLLPGMSESQTSAYASAPAVTVLENSAAAQGVKHNSLLVTAVNFWQDGSKTVGEVTSNKKAAVAMQEVADTSLRVSVADPTHANTGTIALEIAKSATGVVSSDPGVTVTQLSPTIKLTVNVNAARGKSFAAEFELAGSGGPGGPFITEDFASGAGNFTVIHGGTWAVSGGKYRLTAAASQLPHGNLSIHNTPVTASAYTVTADAANTGSSNGFRDVSLVFNYTDENNYYYVSYSEEGAPNIQTNGIFKYVNGVLTELANITATTSAGTTHALKVERDGSVIRAYLDNTLVATATDSTFGSGRVGFGSRNDNAEFDNLIVQ